MEAFLKEVDYDALPTATQVLRENLAADEAARQSSKRDIRDLPITFATIPTSKGLAADYVFLAYFNADSICAKDPTDEDIFNFVVAMTRAKKGLSIISTTTAVPRFVEWIDPSRIDQDLMPNYESMKGSSKPKAE